MVKKLEIEIDETSESDDIAFIPIEFDWRGKTWRTRERISAWVSLQLGTVDQEDAQAMAALAMDFWEAVIVAEQWKAMLKMLKSASPAIGANELRSAMVQVNSSIAQRDDGSGEAVMPPKASPSSPTGSGTSVEKSTDDFS